MHNRDSVSYGITDGYLHREILNTLMSGQPLHDENVNVSPATDKASEAVSAHSPFVKAGDDVTNWVDTTGQSTLSQELEASHIALKETLPPSPEDCFISKSTAYMWLLTELQLRSQLDLSHPNTRDHIKLRLLQTLRSHDSSRVMRSQKSKRIVSIKLQLPWGLHEYIDSLKLGISPDMWEHVLCLTGVRADLQLVTVAAYIRQTWPLSGGHLEHMLLDFLRCKPFGSCLCMYGRLL